MSSQQVQFLQRQVERKNAQIQVLLMALDGCEREKELSESVACAFAWDLVTTLRHHWVGDEVAVTQGLCWSKALDTSRAARTATEIALEEAGK